MYGLKPMYLNDFKDFKHDLIIILEPKNLYLKHQLKYGIIQCMSFCPDKDNTSKSHRRMYKRLYHAQYTCTFLMYLLKTIFRLFRLTCLGGVEDIIILCNVLKY